MEIRNSKITKVDKCPKVLCVIKNNYDEKIRVDVQRSVFYFCTFVIMKNKHWNQGQNPDSTKLASKTKFRAYFLLFLNSMIAEHSSNKNE